MRNLTSVLQCQCTPIGLLTLLDGIFERLVLLVSKETEPGQRAYAVSPMNLQMPKVAGQSGGGTSACSNISGNCGTSGCSSSGGCSSGAGGGCSS